MKDMLGTDVSVGDVLLELGRGGGWVDGKDFYSMKLWEMPEENDGHGYAYNIDGTKYKYAWANLRSSVKIEKDEMPEGFMFAFYHGMSDLNTPLKDGELMDIIDESDWHKRNITEKDVSEFDEISKLEINSKIDVLNNIDVLMNSRFINYNIMEKVLNLFNISEHPVINGESGIAKMYDIQNYHNILYHVKYSPDEISE